MPDADPIARHRNRWFAVILLVGFSIVFFLPFAWMISTSLKPLN